MGKRIGIITWHYYPNYGSALQSYALQTYLEELGHKVNIIDYRDIKYGYINKFKFKIKNIMCSLGVRKIRDNNPFLVFQNHYMKLTKMTQMDNELLDLCKDKDCIICGSDQIWAPNVFNPIYMLDFLEGDIKKISYAASIGLNNIPSDLVETYKEHLSKFDYISVREEAGKNILKKYDIASIVVLDPTLLNNVKVYEKIEKKPTEIKYQEYIFCYFLADNHEYKKQVFSYAEAIGIKVIGISYNKKDSEWMDILNMIGPCEFLWLIHNAHTVFTDSYHGTIFSLLYHKNFYIFERFKKDNPINQNTRIYQLDNMFDIEKRILKNNNIITEDNKFDYTDFEKNLDTYRDISYEFLQEALK